ncbi:MAG TPA: Fmu (Sun) domain-containing protein [Puia sp.]
MKFDNQLRYARTIIDSYQGEMPLHVWLKDFFRQHRQMGSRDRKTVAGLVYGFYRLGHSAREMGLEDRMLLGVFLTNHGPGELLEYFRPEWNKQVERPLEEKIALVEGFDPDDIFPWKQELSETVDHHAFCLSFLRQPDLFLRIRPGYKEQVLQQLTYELIPPFTLRLPNGTKVEELFTPDKEVVIQDLNSQRVGEFLRGEGAGTAPGKFWDACAASGGKALLLHDLYPDVEITVSDIRESILRNLQQRFHRAGVKDYHSFMVDLSKPDPWMPAERMDLVLTDVPCTGSGTWSRTPEELYFFNPQKISDYHSTQKSILSNVVPSLTPGACLVYCTCSVFKKENEDMAAFIGSRWGLRQERAEILRGYDIKADTMFAGRFQV